MAWFQHVSNAVYTAACRAFNLDPASQEGLARFVPAYLPNATTPQADRDVNVCYYAVSERQGTAWDYTMQEAGNSKISVTKTIPVTVLFTFYGPNADDDAEFFWSALRIDTGYGSPRQVLRGSRIALDGTPQRPVSIFEVEGTFHRRRCDVRVDLSYLDVEDKAAAMVTSPPDITARLNQD